MVTLTLKKTAKVLRAHSQVFIHISGAELHESHDDDLIFAIQCLIFYMLCLILIFWDFRMTRSGFRCKLYHSLVL